MKGKIERTEDKVSSTPDTACSSTDSRLAYILCHAFIAIYNMAIAAGFIWLCITLENALVLWGAVFFVKSYQHNFNVKCDCEKS